MWNLFLGDKFLLQMLQPFPSFLGEFQFLEVCLHSLTVQRRKTHVPLQNVFTPGRMVTLRKASHLHHLMQRPHVTTEQLSDPENFSISLRFIFSWNLAVIRVAGNYCVRCVGFGFLHTHPQLHGHPICHLLFPLELFLLLCGSQHHACVIHTSLCFPSS